MPKLYVERSTMINAEISTVFPLVSDLGNWRQWSTWLVQEPEATNTVREDGKFSKWEGRRIGSGEMTITNEVSNKGVFLDLTFLKPWKSYKF